MHSRQPGQHTWSLIPLPPSSNTPRWRSAPHRGPCPVRSAPGSGGSGWCIGSYSIRPLSPGVGRVGRAVVVAAVERAESARAFGVRLAGAVRHETCLGHLTSSSGNQISQLTQYHPSPQSEMTPPQRGQDAFIGPPPNTTCAGPREGGRGPCPGGTRPPIGGSS